MHVIEHRSAEERAAFFRAWYQLTRHPFALMTGAL
jgi:hypothetical protein